jgi:hypothetical protein
MISTTPLRRLRAVVVLAAVAAVLLATPLVVLAHAELETASPDDGAVLETPPAEIVLTFTEELASSSHVELIGPGGTELAAGGVDPSNDLVMRIDVPDLEPGTYEVRSTAISAHDDHIERPVVSFTVSEPTPAPTASPTPSPTAAESATPAPSASPTIASSPSPSPSADGTAASATDVIIPIVAAIVLVAVLGGWLLNRSRGRGPA